MAAAVISKARTTDSLAAAKSTEGGCRSLPHRAACALSYNPRTTDSLATAKSAEGGFPSPRRAACALFLIVASAFFCEGLYAQDNYEIQVYGSELVKPGDTMLELHSNFTWEGSKTTSPEGMLPTNHALHETVEITHGFTDWFETGFYIFTSASSLYGWDWVGDHIRPRVAVPESWNWPVGVSLSVEVGYQQKPFSPDTWTMEIRPIIDKTLGRWYLCFNPTLDRSFHGPSVSQGVVFSPNVKVGYDLTKKINVGFEYYGSLGPLQGFDPIGQQQQQIVPCFDLNLGAQWEFNFGVGIGLTHSTDHLLTKMILGRRFNWGHREKAPAPPPTNRS